MFVIGDVWDLDRDCLIKGKFDKIIVIDRERLRWGMFEIMIVKDREGLR